tara:strand:- start:958 stop:1203 length:246 start_codon:yes stop_codon:yes gene_type:complete
MKIIVTHLRDNDISYVDHMKRAVVWAGEMSVASIALSIHAFIPCAFTKTASSMIEKINKEMNGKIDKKINCCTCKSDGEML